MEAIFNGHNEFVWLQTGYGKSIFYQALPFMMDLRLDTRLVATKPQHNLQTLVLLLYTTTTSACT